MLGGGRALNGGGRILVAAKWKDGWKTGGSGITGGMLVSCSLEDLGRVPGEEHEGEKQGEK